MADYKAIHGKNVLHVASDLDNAEGEGQIWFNTTSSDYKTITKATGAWATGNDVNTARAAMGGAGIQTAAVIFGGYTGPPGSDVSEEYDGTSWTEGNNLTTARQYFRAGYGLQTAAIAVSGAIGSTLNVSVEHYDGSSWSEVGDVNSGLKFGSGGGSQTAGIVFAGGSPESALTESFNGTSWTEVGDLNAGAQNVKSGGSGTQTAALCVSGYPVLTKNESWDGSSWTEVADVPTGVNDSIGSGTQTAMLFGFGRAGGSPVSVNAESYTFDGTTWTAVADANTGKDQGTGCDGTTSLGLAVAGRGPGTSTNNFNDVEEWNFDSTLVAGAWATGEDLNEARRQMGAAGVSNTSSLVFGGAEPTASAKAESFDGSSWTEVADLDNARHNLVGLGTQTAALAVGGNPPTNAGYTESWNGTAWTEANVLSRGDTSPAASSFAMGAGSSTSALFFGGDEGGNTQDLCESWDGTNWTEVADLNGGKSYAVGAGTSNQSAIVYGGYPSVLDETEIWDGSSWTEVANLNTARSRNSGACQGTATLSLCFGGDASPDHQVVTEQWDGVAWTEVADLSTGVNDSGGSGVQSSAMSVGGVNAPSADGVVGTEAWTRAQNVEIITD